jgi:hypothetical protein
VRDGQNMGKVAKMGFLISLAELTLRGQKRSEDIRKELEINNITEFETTKISVRNTLKEWKKLNFFFFTFDPRIKLIVRKHIKYIN